jgi:acyl dehydratase
VNPEAHLNAPEGMRIGDRFGKEVVFTAEAIRAFASAIGDTNPLHHDEALAAASPFGRIIASGAHSFSLMLAVVPDYLKAWTPRRFGPPPAAGARRRSGDGRVGGH